jgi:hypothetical protein
VTAHGEDLLSAAFADTIALRQQVSAAGGRVVVGLNLKTIALTGRDGGAIGRGGVDIHVNVPSPSPSPSPSTARVQDVHRTLHVICDLVPRATDVRAEAV